MQNRPTDAKTGQFSARTPIEGKRARRATRRAAAFAKEQDFHSFRVYVDGSVTYTLRHDKLPTKPKSKHEGSDTANRELSQRKTRSRDRAKTHRELQARE